MNNLLGLILLQSQAVVDTAMTVGNVEAETRLSLWRMFNYGGWIMYVLLLLSIIAVYIFVERLITVNKAMKDDKSFMMRLKDYIYEGNVKAARGLCANADTPMSHMIDKGLSRLGKPLNDISTTIETEGRLEVSLLEKNIAFVATISGVAPMLGFLGTVIGMVRAFYNMSMAGNNLDITTLSSGIYQAMITTVGGLIVGVCAYIFYNVLVARIEKVVFLLEAKATEFMDLLNEPAEK